MDELRRSVLLSFGALATSLTTLICCVLPAVLVSLGAGAALVGLLAAVPQLIWLSERKGLVFGTASAMLVACGLVLWNARSLPCPADPRLASACRRLRRISVHTYLIAAVLTGAGAFTAFVLPHLAD